MQAYKVCLVSPTGQPTSITMGEWRTVYTFDWVRPKFQGSAFFCFDSHEKAVQYARINRYHNNDDLAIYEVEIEPFGKRVENIPACNSTDGAMKTFWKTGQVAANVVSIPCPPGTVMAKAVKLIREVARLDGMVSTLKRAQMVVKPISEDVTKGAWG